MESNQIGNWLPQINEFLAECQRSPNGSCINKLKHILDNSWLNNMSEQFRSSIEKFNRPCNEVERYSWMIEREYFVAITMGLMACIGLTGNLFSCLIISIYLIKLSGTFILFLFLSIADSLVVILQTVDAYRNSVAVDFYTLILPEEVHNPQAVWRRDWNCKLFLFFWHFGLQLSAWLVMALSVDRYASLKNLYITRNKKFMYRRAWFIGGLVVILITLVNLPFLIHVKSVVYEMPCGVSFNNYFIIFFVNILIIITLM